MAKLFEMFRNIEKYAEIIGPIGI